MEINNDGINPIIKKNTEKKIKQNKREESSSVGNTETKKSPVNPNFYSNYFGITSFKGTEIKLPEKDTERLEYLKSLKDTDGTPLFEEGIFNEKTDGDSYTKSRNKNESYLTLYKNKNAFDAFCMLKNLTEAGGKPVVRKDNLSTILLYTDAAAGAEEIEMWDVKGKFVPDKETEDLLKQLLSVKNNNGSPLFPKLDEICFLFATLKSPSLDVSEMIDIIRDTFSMKDENGKLFADEETLQMIALYKTSKNPSYDIKSNLKEYQDCLSKNINPIMAITFTDLDEEQRNVLEKLFSYKTEDENNLFGGLLFSPESAYRILTSGKMYDGMFDDIDTIVSKKKNNGKQLYNGYKTCRMILSDEDTRNRILNFVRTQDIEIQEYLDEGNAFMECFKSDDALNRAVTIASLKKENGESVVPTYYASYLIKNQDTFNTFMKYYNDFMNLNVSMGEMIKLSENGNDICERVIELLGIKNSDGKQYFSWYKTDDLAKDELSFEFSKLMASQKNDEGKNIYTDWQISDILQKGENFVRILFEMVNKTDADGKKYYNPVDLKKTINFGENELKLLKTVSATKNRFGEKLFLTGKDDIDFVTYYSLNGKIKETEKSEEIISNLIKFSELRNPNDPEKRLLKDYTLKYISLVGNTDEVIENINELLQYKNENGETVFGDEKVISSLITSPERIKNAIELYNLTDENGERIFTDSKPILDMIFQDKLDYNLALKYAMELNKDLNCNCSKSEKEELIVNIIKNGEDCCKDAIALKNELLKSGRTQKYDSFDFLTGAKFFEFYQKSKLSQFSLTEKRTLLKKFVAINSDFFETGECLRKDFPLVPQDKTEYCDFLQGLAKSIGIETNPLTPEQINKFNEDITELYSLLQNSDINPVGISQKISTKQLLNEIEEKTKNLDLPSKKDVYDYFCFDIVDGKLKGYPANLFNEKKLSEIDNEDTKRVIEELRPLIKEYTENNPVTINCRGNADETNVNRLNKVFNDVISALPEIRTTIEKAQHKTHSYDLAMHSFNVLKEVVNDENFKKLNESDKKVMILASLLHDITKAEGVIDKTHEKESAFDAFFITEKLNLTQSEKSKLYDLIANHEWFEHVNKKSLNDNERSIVAEDMAFALRTSNTFELAQIFTKADLKSVTADNWFYSLYINDMPECIKLINEKINYLKSSQPILPLGVIPKASEIKEGDGVYKNDNGNVIIKLNEITDFEKIGFPKGTNKDNFKIMVHALDKADQLAKFTSFSLADSDALLSTSYVIKPQSEFRVFRPQGLIINTDTSNIHAGVNMDYGTGCGKNLETLKRKFMFGAYRAGDRRYFSDLIKSKFSFSDEEYNEFVEKYSNKTFAEINDDNPELCEKLIETFEEIELGNRRHGRSYNEVLITRPQISGVFLYDTDIPSTVGNPVNFIERQEKERFQVDLSYLLDFAKQNDLPVVVFGD